MSQPVPYPFPNPPAPKPKPTSTAFNGKEMEELQNYNQRYNLSSLDGFFAQYVQDLDVGTWTERDMVYIIGDEATDQEGVGDLSIIGSAGDR